MAPFLLIRSWKVKKIVCSSIKKSFEKQGQVRKKEENLTSKTWNWKKGHFLPYSRLHCWCVCVHYDDFLCRLIQCILELFYWFLFFMSWQNFYEFETDDSKLSNSLKKCWKGQKWPGENWVKATLSEFCIKRKLLNSISPFLKNSITLVQDYSWVGLAGLMVKSTLKNPCLMYYLFFGKKMF